MTDKDPKDMTAAELLREADSNPCSMCHLVMTGDESCATTGCASWAYRLADKIDAELAQATAYGISEGFNSSLRAGAELWAKANGWPDFREDEGFGAWIGRCAFAKPLDDCGEPVQIGERIDDKVRGDVEATRISYTANGVYFNNSHNASGTRIAQRITYVPGERVKRPAPEVLGADGRPIKEGETVYDVDTGEARVIRLPCAGTGKTFFEGGGYRDPAYLTHTPPDTLERLRDDMAKRYKDNGVICLGQFIDRLDAIIERKGGDA